MGEIKDDEQGISIFCQICDDCRLMPSKNNFLMIPKPTLAVNLSANPKGWNSLKQGMYNLPPLIRTVNQLTLKDKLQKCSVCREKSKLRCHRCDTCFCCNEHWAEDHVHRIVCGKLNLLKYPRVSALTALDRARMGLIKQTILEDVLEDLVVYAQENINKGAHIVAYEALTKAMEYNKDAYGQDSLQHAVLFLLMFDSLIERGLDHDAEKVLVSATASVESCGVDDPLPSINGLIQRAYGRLYLKRHDPEEAQFHFAEALYTLASHFGPNDLRCAFGYLHLGEARLMTGEHTLALSLFEHCLEIWYDYCVNSIMDSELFVSEWEGVRKKSFLETNNKKQVFVNPVLVDGAKVVVSLIANLTELRKTSGSLRLQLARSRLCASILFYKTQNWQEARKWLRVTKMCYAFIKPADQRIQRIMRYVRREMPIRYRPVKS